MKKHLLPGVLLLVFAGVITNKIYAEQTRILWLGNSYVTVNNLPQLFHDLALSAGDSVIFDSNAPGGTTLQQHSVNATSIQKIYSQPWDYVIVQAQSQEPSFPPAQVASQTFPYARVLDSLIRDNDSCTQTVFYMTWGKKYGDQQNCGGYPILCTFDGVQSRLTESYVQMANDNDALVAPAGRAWQTSWHTDTLINLWNADNSHPNIAGSYLTACVFYGTIFRKSPVGIVYSPISAQTTNDYLQNIAYHTVFDTLSNWNIGKFDVKASFEAQAPTPFTFNFYMWGATNVNSFIWNFGDGTTSTTSGTHTYANNGTYTVTLIAFDNCGNSDTSSQIFSVGANAVTDGQEEVFTLSPNPVKDKLVIDCQKNSVIHTPVEILDVTGKSILKIAVKQARTETDVQHLQAGIYFLKTDNGVKKFLKQ